MDSTTIKTLCVCQRKRKYSLFKYHYFYNLAYLIHPANLTLHNDLAIFLPCHRIFTGRGLWFQLCLGFVAEPVFTSVAIIVNNLFEFIVYIINSSTDSLRSELCAHNVLKLWILQTICSYLTAAWQLPPNLRLGVQVSTAWHQQIYGVTCS